jgi:hypothetical protein
MVVHGRQVVMLLGGTTFKEIVIYFLVHSSHVKGKGKVVFIHFSIITATTAARRKTSGVTLFRMFE